MNAFKWPRAAAYVRLSVTYRRTFLNTWLYQWQEQVQGIVLDVGGEKHSLVSHDLQSRVGIRKWIYLNINPSTTPDLVADGAHIPLATAVINTALCLETLEHVEDPPQVVRELSRVLHPTGKLLLSVPFLYRIHAAPNDFWRFTEHQVRYMVRRAGLEIVHMEHLGLFFTVLCDMIKQAISEIRWTPLRWLLGLLFLPLGAVLVGLERFVGRHSPGFSSFTTGYLVLASKPSSLDVDKGSTGNGCIPGLHVE